jgi:hypothetical protein
MAESSGRSPAVIRSPPSLDVAALPRAVALLRARILQTASGRDIDDLRVPLGWNEVPPLFTRGQKSGFDPIGFLRGRSFDGQGLEMLAILRAVFSAAFVREIRGPSVSYLWPVFPVTPEKAPSSAEQLAVWCCVRFADLTLSTPAGKPPVHRAAIGEDGTWQYFWPEPPAR